jgi:hypothetical protein
MYMRSWIVIASPKGVAIHLAAQEEWIACLLRASQ